MILVSPEGTKSTYVHVPGRRKKNGTVAVVLDFNNDPAKSHRQNRAFCRLLSKGWKVVANTCSLADAKAKVKEYEKKIREEEKKQTSLVDGSKKTGSKSHGGDHASGEVENSPNAYDKGNRKRYLRRGKRGERRGKRNNQSSGQPFFQQTERRNRNRGVYAPQRLKFQEDIIKEAQKSSELLYELTGASNFKVKKGVVVNTEELLINLEIGANPLPALEAPDEKQKIRVLITPDFSGSTQQWSGLGAAWAHLLAQDENIDSLYLENFNGSFQVKKGEIKKEEIENLLGRIDLLIYLGDRDGYELCKRYAQQGVKTVVGFDSYSARVANPRVRKNSVGPGTLYWVDRVSVKSPETWTQGLKKVIDML